MLEHIDTERFTGEPVGVVYGGDSSERQISLDTGRALADALRDGGYDVTEYDWPSDRERLVEERPAAVLLALHGGSGENGVIQGFLESVGIPYTGSGVMASALAMDKGRAKALFADDGLATPGDVRLSYQVAADLKAKDVDWEEWLAEHHLTLPLVVKPTDAGSSVGISICTNVDTFADAIDTLVAESGDGADQSASAGILIEEYIDGPEYTVGIFDEVSLGALQVVPGEAFYDYTAKYESDDTEYRSVEDATLAGRLETVGRRAFDAIGCRGVARVDVITREQKEAGRVPETDELYVLEVNTIPGMTATSLVPKLAKARGIDFASFAELMLSAASNDSSAT